MESPSEIGNLPRSLVIRRSDERGKADHGWLVARHSFSFADYTDPAHHHFRTLRVINEDRIAPATGSGVQHSEFNPSKNDPTHLLQIWIMPIVKGAPPRYAQRKFEAAEKLNQLCLIAEGNASDESQAIGIRQDAKIYASILELEKKIVYGVHAGRGLWLQVISGTIVVEEKTLVAGDGAKLEGYRSIQIVGKDSRSEFLFFDLR